MAHSDKSIPSPNFSIQPSQANMNRTAARIDVGDEAHIETQGSNNELTASPRVPSKAASPWNESRSHPVPKQGIPIGAHRSLSELRLISRWSPLPERARSREVTSQPWNFQKAWHHPSHLGASPPVRASHPIAHIAAGSTSGSGARKLGCLKSAVRGPKEVPVSPLQQACTRSCRNGKMR
jgi:hypothetical protein